MHSVATTKPNKAVNRRRGNHHSDSASARRARRSSAEAAHRLSVLGRLRSDIARDFRDLLTVIDASLRLLAEDADPKNARTHTDGARMEIERGLELMAQLLPPARKASAQSNDVNGVLRKLDPFLKYAAGPDVQITRNYATALPICVFDVGEFTSAILDLVINARDAMPGGGRVHISTAVVEPLASGTLPKRSYVKVTVADTGHGMSYGMEKKIFEPFFTTKAPGKGTGLGLSIQDFMRRAGGNVIVTSRPQRGTAVELLFPVMNLGDAER